MRVQEATVNYLSILQESSLCRWGIHIIATMTLNVLLTYYFSPSNQLYTLTMAAILWQMTWEDLKTRQIDIRSVGALFIVGQFVLPDYYNLISVFIAGSVMSIGFTLYEFSAKKVRPDSGVGGDVQYNSPDCCINEYNAPPFIPLVLIGVVFLLTYYLMSWQLLSTSIEFMLFTRMPIDLPIQFFIVPFAFWYIYIKMKYRHDLDREKGFNIVYQVMGEGDIWVLASIAGIFGFTFTCFAVIIAVFMGLIWLTYIKRGACDER